MMCSNTNLVDGIGNIFNYISCILITSLVPVLFSIAMVAFIWGVIQTFINPNNEEARKKGKAYVLWGLIGLFIMVTMWSLVGVFTDTFGLGAPVIPVLSQ